MVVRLPVNQHLINARIMAKKAIEAREKVYQGMREASQRFNRLFGEPTYAALLEEDEVQKWMTTPTCAALIADNRWNMSQSDMYAGLAQAELLQELVHEIKKLREDISYGRPR